VISVDGALLAVGVPFVMVLVLRWLFVTATNQGVIKPFLSGAATAFVALLIEILLWEYFSIFLSGEYALALRTFLFVALPEELVKMALIYTIVIELHELGFRQIGILAAAVGAGFAAAENVFYILQLGETVVWLRLLTATPFHIFVAIVAAKIIYLGVQRERPEFIGIALLAATVLHGMYDYLLLVDQAGNGKFLFALALTSSLAINLLRHEKRS
jgi:protease PrsW